jgi:hypothetical protein
LRIRDKEFEKARPLIRDYVEKYYANNSDMITKRINELNSVWKPIEKKVFDKMKEITHREFPWPDVSAFVTIIGRCDYNINTEKPYYKVPLDRDPRLVPSICVHELLHFSYHHYDEPAVLKKLTKKESEDLKESLTFLINTDFSSILVAKDEGYPMHQQLRQQLQEFWQEHKNYDALIQKGIRLIEAQR